MSAGFVQGGVGEVPIATILDRNKGFWTRADKEAAAAAYEAKHPGSIVIRDWWNDHDLAAARKGRKVAARPTVTMGGDPERMGKELRRAYVQIQTIDPSHVEYERLWRNATDTAHHLEDACGIPRSTFTKGAQAKKADEPISNALQEKLNAYVEMPPKKRKAAIEEIDDVALLTLIRDNEPQPELQTLAVERLATAGAL